MSSSHTPPLPPPPAPAPPPRSPAPPSSGAAEQASAATAVSRNAGEPAAAATVDSDGAAPATPSTGASASSAPVQAASPMPPGPAGTAAIVAEFTKQTARRVLMGTCGWNDASILKCGRFYPASVKTAVDRLRHYSSHFPCVEVDTSNYAIPGESQVLSWMAQTPPTFRFHWKIFGMFAAGRAEFKALPSAVRHLVPPERVHHGAVQLRHTTQAFQDALWSVQNRILHVLHSNGRLGVVVFQFHLSFGPTEANKNHVRWCRAHLGSAFQMGIEFRSRAWFTDEAETRRTVEFARELGCALIAEDDLEHEVTGRFIPLPPGQTPVRLPIHLHVASPGCLYIRLHRRQGNQRVLSAEELEEWVVRFDQARSEVQGAHALRGPIWFLIGTDYEDQPVINAQRMQAALEGYDEQRRKEYELQIRAHADGGAAAHSPLVPALSVAAVSLPSSAAAAPSAAPPTAPAAPLPPEPLAFDYRSFSKQHLSRLPSGVHSDKQTSLGAFFTKQPTQTQAHTADAAAGGGEAAAEGVKESKGDDASPAAATHPTKRAAAAGFAALFGATAVAASPPRAGSIASAPHAAASPSHPAAASKRAVPSPPPAASASSSSSSPIRPSPAKKAKRGSSTEPSAAAASTPRISSFFERSS